ncbi:MAG: ABC transporter permease [Acidobacteria bacterium]|nr:ABC transporter permease [Acidobacteriota bacterium]
MFNLRALFHKNRAEREMDDELRFHLEKQIEQNIASGMSAEEARSAALRQFGNVGVIKEECRDSWGVRFINELAQDLRYGLRQLRRNPGFTAVAVLTLALGIGANTAIFAIIDGMILRPFPVASPNQLVRIGIKTPQGSNDRISYPDYKDLRQQASDFAGFLLWDRESAFLNSMDESSQIPLDVVSPDYFTTLGVPAFRGRTFLPEMDSGSPKERTIVISYRLWKTRLGADPNIVGKTVKLTGKPTLVLGIAPPGFQGLSRFVPTDAWVLASQRQPGTLHQRGDLFFEALGRLKKGTTVAQARTQLDTIGRRLAAAYSATHKTTAFDLVPESMSPLKEFAVTSLLLALPALVLLIACANVAGLLLARGEARRRELAIRVALGAGRMRVTRQLITEGFLLSIVGAGLGLLVTCWFIGAEASLMPPFGPFQIGPILKIDGRLLLFTLAITVLATVAFSLAPALQGLRTRPSAVLKDEEAGWRRAGRRISLRSVLVAGQIAVSVVMLTAAMLLVRSLDYTLHLPVGFEIHRNLLVVNLFPTTKPNIPAWTFLPDLAEKLGSLPGVERATCARRILLSGSGGGLTAPVSIPGVRLPGGESTIPILFNSVGPEYFRTVGTQILAGRDFGLGDGPQSQKVAIVSETMAKRFWHNGDVIGRSLNIAGAHYQIVGIAEDAKIVHVHEPPAPYMYLPIAQSPSTWGTLILETRGDPRSLVPAVRTEIRQAYPATAIRQVQTSKQLLSFATWDDAMLARVAGALSLLGVFLAAIGLYGVISFLVTRQTHEIGIRMALGARTWDVVATILRQGLRMTAVGTVIGAIAAFATTRFMVSGLYGISPYDVRSFIGAVLVVSAVSLLACYIPARRAAKVDPMVALRYE